VHREFAYAFPPVSLTPRFLQKARADGFRGVVVVPFVTSHVIWPTLMAASLTHVPGSKDRCRVVRVNPMYVRHTGEPSRTQRLAVLAVDFTKAQRREFPEVVPPCAEHASRRLRPSLVSPIDEADRTRIRAQLLRAGVTVRGDYTHAKRART
jgi:hypothetical protein